MDKRTFALFVIACALTLLVTVPATLLDWSLQYATQGRAVLANADGTIWKGSATPALRTQDHHFIVLQPLRWAIDPLSLLSGHIKVRLHWDDLPAAPAMEALISPRQIDLNHVQIPLPANALSEISPMLKAGQFRGQLQIQSEHLAISKRGMEGTAAVDWQQAGSALSSVAPLGNYHLTLNGAGERVDIALTTASGVLLLEGNGNWQAARGLEFQGKAQASSSNNENLAELLHHLGPEISPGVHSFRVTPK